MPAIRLPSLDHGPACISGWQYQALICSDAVIDKVDKRHLDVALDVLVQVSVPTRLPVDGYWRDVRVELVGYGDDRHEHLAAAIRLNGTPVIIDTIRL